MVVWYTTFDEFWNISFMASLALRGDFLKKRTACKTKNVTFWRSLVIPFWYRIQNLRKKLVILVSRTCSKTLSASSSDSSKLKKEFWSQCHILLFGVHFCIVFLVDQKPSPKLRPRFSLCQFAYFSLYNQIISKYQKGAGVTSETVLPTMTHGARD